MQKAWTDDAWADYVHWQTEDKKTLKRIKATSNNQFARIIEDFGSFILWVWQGE